MLATNQILSNSHPNISLPLKGLPRIVGERETSLALKQLKRYGEVLSQPLMCYDVHSKKILACTADPYLCDIPAEIGRIAARIQGPRVFPLSSGLMYFMLPLPPHQGNPVVAVGFIMSRANCHPSEIVIEAAQRGWSEAELMQWTSSVGYCQPEIFENLLIGVVQQVQSQKLEEAAHKESRDLTTRLNYTCEEIDLLHTLMQNMQVSRTPREVAEMSLKKLRGVIPSEGHIVWLEDKNNRPLFLVEGQLPFDEIGLLRLIARFEDNDWSRPLIKNNVKATLLGADFPGLRNFILVPIADGNQQLGWLCSCNLRHEQEFAAGESSLIASVASLLATHGRNVNLFREHQELLLSFVRALVSSLDAKDPYTRGHSERVALIARRIAVEMNLPEDDLRDVYLAGLLHDVGKIGVDDQILRKPGQLTREEFEQVKKHPMIGYNILAQLKNLRNVIPGVRHHHEAWMGTGYPDGLSGETIPLMARILAVADSYDAMGSDRPYRKGMPLPQLEKILQDGAAAQWDPEVVEAYFSARDAIREICETYSPSTNVLEPTILSANFNRDEAAATSEKYIG